MRNRSWIGPVVLAALVLLTALISTGTHGDDAGPNGTLAFRRFLGEMGLAVSDGDERAATGTFVLLADLRSEEQARALLERARSGVRIVLTDPTSALAIELGIVATHPLGGFPATRSIAPGCPLVEADRVRVSARGRLLRGPPFATRCFDGFMVSVPVGRGSVVVLGDVSPFTNELLRHDDNAIFAYMLTAPGPVVFGAPLPTGAPAPCVSVWSCLPARGRAVVWQIAIAACLYALARARRLGRPLPETVPAPIPAGELVRAAARLYRAAGAREEAARAMRAAAVSRWGRRLGLGRATDTPAVARAARVDEARVHAALDGSPPGDDDALISLGRELAAIDEGIGR